MIILGVFFTFMIWFIRIARRASQQLPDNLKGKSLSGYSSKQLKRKLRGY